MGKTKEDGERMNRILTNIKDEEGLQQKRGKEIKVRKG
jgi:hypothetical protein